MKNFILIMFLLVSTPGLSKDRYEGHPRGLTWLSLLNQKFPGFAKKVQVGEFNYENNIDTDGCVMLTNSTNTVIGAPTREGFNKDFKLNANFWTWYQRCVTERFIPFMSDLVIPELKEKYDSDLDVDKYWQDVPQELKIKQTKVVVNHIVHELILEEFGTSLDERSAFYLELVEQMEDGFMTIDMAMQYVALYSTLSDEFIAE